MKITVIAILFCMTAIGSFAQKQTYDLTTYTLPKGWKKTATENAIQLLKEDAAKGRTPKKAGAISVRMGKDS